MPEKEKRGSKKRRGRSREELYPNFNWRPPREGRSLVIFKGPSMKTGPKPSSQKSESDSPTDGKRSR